MYALDQMCLRHNWERSMSLIVVKFIKSRVYYNKIHIMYTL